jgi:hypothetical protein
VFSSKRQLFAGMIIGGMVATTGIAAADPNSVTAIIEDWVKFQFNGVEKSIPEGFDVLNYNGRVYVPARFIAEQLGGTVDWDSNTQTVKINSDLQNQLNEKQQQIEKLNDQLSQLQKTQSNNPITGSGESSDKYKIDNLDISVDYSSNGQTKSITVHGTIKNVSSSSQRPKNIIVILYDSMNTSIGYKTYPFDRQLTINEEEPFSVPIDNPPAKIHHYVVRVE